MSRESYEILKGLYCVVTVDENAIPVLLAGEANGTPIETENGTYQIFGLFLHPWEFDFTLTYCNYFHNHHLFHLKKAIEIKKELDLKTKQQSFVIPAYMIFD